MKETLSDEETAKLSPGVRDLVVWLNEQGFVTCDSGDGSNYEMGMGCAVPEPMIVIEVNMFHIAGTANQLHHLLNQHGVDFTPKYFDDSGDKRAHDWPTIHASYDPEDRHAVIILLNVTSGMVDMT